MAKAKNFNFQTTTSATREHRTWFRGEHTHYNPTVSKMYDADATAKYILKGWEPQAPVITPTTQITAFGSCFAANISNYLSARNFRVLTKDDDAKAAYVVTCGEGMVNSFVIRQQFEWAWEGKKFPENLWVGYDKKDYGYDPEVQAMTKKMFDETEVFILTFGLSEVWYDEPTGEVFWRTIPKDVYDPNRHKFRVSTVQENKDNMRKIYDLIRKHRPDAKIIFTLSPIPLIATFRDNSCLTSNSVSKSVLRVAVDEMMREVGHEGHLHYWPSYELVTDVFKNPFKPDRRHPYPIVLNYIMALFEHTWCHGGDTPPPNLTLAWGKALAVSGLIPEDLAALILAGRRVGIRRLVRQKSKFHSDGKIDKAIREFAMSYHDALGNPEAAVKYDLSEENVEEE